MSVARVTTQNGKRQRTEHILTGRLAGLVIEGDAC
jgi:hypothetical protein